MERTTRGRHHEPGAFVVAVLLSVLLTGGIVRLVSDRNAPRPRRQASGAPQLATALANTNIAAAGTRVDEQQPKRSAVFWRPPATSPAPSPLDASPTRPPVPQTADVMSRIRLTGRVTGPDGAPLAGVVVDVQALGCGTLTTEDGEFDLALPAGTHRLRVWRMDHAAVERVVEVASGTAGPHLLIRLRSCDLRLDPTVVSASRHPEPQLAPPGRYVLGPRALQRQIGSFEDVMRSVQSLPGVSTASDFHGEFFVRGSGSHANAVYLDGIEIFFPYHILGFNSIFNPGLIESVEFFSGDAPAAYGDATGGVLAVRSRGFSAAASRANVGLSYLSGHVRAAGGDADRGWSLSLRRSYHDKLVQLVDDVGGRQIPSFYDAMLRARWRPSARHLLVGGLLIAGDGLSLPSPEASALHYDFVDLNADGGGDAAADKGSRTADRDRLQLHNQLAVGSLYWRAVLGERAYVETTFGYVPQRLRFSLQGDNHESVDITTRVLSVRQDLTWKKHAHRVRVGLQAYRDATHRRVAAYAGILNLRESNSSINLVDQKERYEIDAVRRRDYAAVYAQDDWSLWSNRLELGMGLRYEHDAWSGENLLSPRVSLQLRADPQWVLRGTMGIYRGLRDKPMEVLPTADGRPLRAERALQTTLGLTNRWTASLQSGITGWIKDSSNLVYEPQPAYYAPGGIGHAHGVETWVEVAPLRGPIRGRIQYTWSVARQLDPVAWRRQPNAEPAAREEFWGLVYEEPYWYSPLQDQRHGLGIDAQWKLGSWEFGARYRLASGRPFTPLDHVVEDDEGNRFGVAGGKGSARLPPYRRLDLRIMRHFRSRGVRWSVFADILNATSADNVYQYRWERSYTQRYSVSMLPTLPTLGLEARF